MSNRINTELLERAAELIDLLTGTVYEKAMVFDLQQNDLEALWHHVQQAEGFIIEMETV